MVPMYFDPELLRKSCKNMFFMYHVLFILAKYAIIHVPFDFLNASGSNGRVECGSH